MVGGEGCDLHKGMTKTNIHTYILIGKKSVLCAYPLGVRTYHTIVESVDLPVL